jgi:hypothetical protein
MRIAGFVLIAAGVLALAYRGFSYTKHHDVDLGPLDVSVSDRETVEIPVWAGAAAVVVGVALVVTRRSS